MIFDAQRTPDGGLLVVLERPRALAEIEVPDRALVRLDARGRFVARFVAPEGAALVHATVQPSGQVTAVLATATAYRLVRLEAALGTVAEVFVETFGPPQWSRDTARVAAAGDDVVLAVRDADHAVWIDRYAFRDGRLQRRARTQIGPSFDLTPSFLTSGSFDPFHQLRLAYRVALDLDAAGNAYVAVATARTVELFARHEVVFGDGLHGILDGNEHGERDHLASDAIVTRVDADGRRRWATVHGTKAFDEPYRLRVHGDALYVVGRSEVTEHASDGWDALVVKASTASGARFWAKTLHAERGDVAFDLAARGDRLYVAAGVGWDDNPTGMSITETCAPVLFELLGSGEPVNVARLRLGPRQTYPHVIVDLGSSWFLGGITDGPGTHSHDADPRGVRAATWTEVLR